MAIRFVTSTKHNRFTGGLNLRYAIANARPCFIFHRKFRQHSRSFKASKRNLRLKSVDFQRRGEFANIRNSISEDILHESEKSSGDNAEEQNRDLEIARDVADPRRVEVDDEPVWRVGKIGDEFPERRLGEVEGHFEEGDFVEREVHGGLGAFRQEIAAERRKRDRN